MDAGADTIEHGTVEDGTGSCPDLAQAYTDIRNQSVSLVEGLSDADCTVQSMPDASPAKWHLAHTSWFFEEFILCGHLGGTQRFDPAFAFLFNSYYDAIGARHARPERGLLTRPTLSYVLEYRQDVDARMRAAIGAMDIEGRALLELGLAHEQQHQELLLTDLLHLFSRNPLRPAYADRQPVPVAGFDPLRTQWTDHPDPGIVTIGHDGQGFAFDCEGPAHDVLLRPFALADRAVTNAQWMQFMEAGGYDDPSFWLSDGWAVRRAQDWNAPLYWEKSGADWLSMTLHGLQPVDPHAPVTHVSFFEADAFASWASAHLEGCDGARLPLETEWEHAARGFGFTGNMMGTGQLRPVPQTATPNLFGDVWEWTASAFLPYPGYRPAAGAVGEYNGKFMSGQRVLRGGSCATPDGHVRASYRNFFHPDKRWQFSGLRLARDL